MADINLGVGAANSATGGYEVSNSLKFESDNSEYLERTQGTPDSRKTGSVSFWIKRTEISTSSVQFAFEAGNTDNDNGRLFLRFQTDDTLRIGGGSTVFRNTTQVFRDTSAWYHILFVMDTTQSTADDRIKLYVNGSQVTDFGTKNNFSQNDLTGINYQKLSWGRSHVDSSAYSNMYLAEAVTLDGVAASPTDFGEFDSDSGIWIPKDLSNLTFGSEGTYLDFSSSSDLGNDVSGNNNDFGTLGNIAAADQAVDTPTNNFCTLNPLMGDNNAPTITEGATKATGGGGTWNKAYGTQGVKNGKWYWEMKVTNTSSSGYFGATTTPAENSELQDAQIAYNTSAWAGNPSRIDYYYWQNGSQVSNESTGWGTLSNNDILGVAIDLDASTKTIAFYKNGTLLSGTTSNPQNLPTNMQDEFIFPFYAQYENRQDELNFGGYTTSSISSAASDANGYGNFEYAPPSGYYALCSKNLAEYA